MQESLKMFDFPGGLLRSTYNLTFGRGKTFYKRPKTLETLANLSRAKKLSLQIFSKILNTKSLDIFKNIRFLKSFFTNWKKDDVR